jgi:hypothetical protein
LAEALESVAVAVDALDEAEGMLVTLSYTGPVRALHARLVALQTVATGFIRQGPRLTEEQTAKLVADSVALARDVAELRGPVEPDK